MDTATNISFSLEDISKVENFASSQKSSVLVIFFDDMKGSSLIKQEMARTEGEEAFQKLRKEHDQVLSEIIKRHGVGEVIKSTGDGLLAVFTEPTTAVERALEIQAYYRNHPYISLRIGMDMGQVRVEKFGGVQKDMFGRHVDWASRAESMSDGGHILVTESVYNDASDWVKRKLVSWKTHGNYYLKEGERPFALFEPYNANITEPMVHPRGNAAPEQASAGLPGGVPQKKRVSTPGFRFYPVLLILIITGVIGLFGFFQIQKNQTPLPKTKTLELAVASDNALIEEQKEYIFSGTPIPIGCDSGKAGQILVKEETGIHWVWKNKKDSYCGWFMEHLPVTDFSRPFIEHFLLEIVYSGKYSGTPSPQVKFIDTQGRHTKLLKISDYQNHINEDKNQVLIPVAEFVNWKEPGEKKMKTIQFDAGWESPNGDIQILSIKFVKKRE